MTMDPELHVELHLWLKRNPLPARICLDATGFYLAFEHREKSGRIRLPNSDGPTILEVMDDVT